LLLMVTAVLGSPHSSVQTFLETASLAAFSEKETAFFVPLASLKDHQQREREDGVSPSGLDWLVRAKSKPALGIDATSSGLAVARESQMRAVLRGSLEEASATDATANAVVIVSAGGTSANCARKKRCHQLLIPIIPLPLQGLLCVLGGDSACLSLLPGESDDF